MQCKVVTGSWESFLEILFQGTGFGVEERAGLGVAVEHEDFESLWGRRGGGHFSVGVGIVEMSDVRDGEETVRGLD